MDEYSCKLEWSNGSGSDLIAMRNAYYVWKTKFDRGDLRELQAEKEFCDRVGLEIRSLHECHALVADLKIRLQRFQFIGLDGSGEMHYNPAEKSIILKVVISGAFYPNFFVTSPSNSSQNDNELPKFLDPQKTVYISGADSTKQRELYFDPIKKLFCENFIAKSDLDCVKLSWDSNPTKIFVTFDTNRNDDDKISLEVYKAVKLRKLRIAAAKPNKQFVSLYGV